MAVLVPPHDRRFSETTGYMVDNGCELLLCPSFGKYEPSRLIEDTRAHGLWAVFVHPEGCQFIHDGEIIFEQQTRDGRGGFALHEVEFRAPRGSTAAGR